VVVELVPRQRPAAPVLDDAEILAGVRAGDSSVSESLYRRVRPQVDRTVVRLLGAADADREDLVQISLIEVVRSIPRFRGECSLDTWTARVSAHTVFRELRRRSSERRVFQPTDIDECDVPSGVYGDTARSVDARSIAARIRAHLQAVDHVKAWTVLLHDVLGHDLREVSEITECSVAAAQSRLVRGRAELEERIDRDPELRGYLERRGMR